MAFLDEIKNFSMDSLEPTETTVRRFPVEGVEELGVLDDEEIKEYEDSEEITRQKAKQMAELIRTSRHFVVYTGAGISTSANIPDYRGPKGVWTLQAQGKVPTSKITLEQAEPTYSHMALRCLMEEGLLKFVVSTNVDGLHRRSGFTADEMAEVHGNIYREYCQSCQAEYLRPFDVTKARGRDFIMSNHRTGRLCSAWVYEELPPNKRLCLGLSKKQCLAPLCDSIVNFGEYLPPRELKLAEENSLKADLTLVLGSSMRVEPACTWPAWTVQHESEEDRGTFCICNLQQTPYDKECEENNGIRFYARTDKLMKMIMEELGLADKVKDFELSMDQIQKEVSEMIQDEEFAGRKYNVNYMVDGPPPKAVLDIIESGFAFTRHVNPVERIGDPVGKVL